MTRRRIYLQGVLDLRPNVVAYLGPGYAEAVEVPDDALIIETSGGVTVSSEPTFVPVSGEHLAATATVYGRIVTYPWWRVILVETIADGRPGS